MARGTVLRAACITLGVGLVVAACASHDRQARKLPVLRVTERDFRIAATPQVLHAGKVELAVRNKGPVAHELLVIRVPGKTLPLRSDGLTVDEDAIERSTVAVLEPGKPGARRTLDIDLKRGEYELICNMFGHYLGGMHARLVVE